MAVESDRDDYAYGAAFGHPLGARTQLLAELYGASNTNFGQDTLNFNIGADVELREVLHLLVSGGAGLREPDNREKLNYGVFLGILYLLN